MTRIESILTRHDAWICALLVIIVFAPYWPSAVLPYHDSIFQYQFFHFAYSQVFTTGELPLWVPYGGYGTAAAFSQLIALTPGSYLAGAVGIALRVQDTLLLFKAGLFLEVAVYAAGLSLLARAVYTHALSRFTVVLGGIFSLSWLFQPYFNFHAFYLYPWLLLFLFAFFRDGDPAKLWLALSTGLVSLIGSAPYFVSLHLFVLTVLCGVAFAAGVRPPMERSLRRWIFRREAALAIVLATVLGVSAWLSVQEVVTVAAGRNLDSIRVPLNVFLNHGRMTQLTALAGSVLGWVTHADNTYYIGLLPLFLVAAGLVRLGNRLFLGVSAAGIALMWLSFGGGFSRLAYFFPGMSLFRHISLTFGLSGLLLLVASGWVLDEWLRRGGDSAKPLRHQRIIVLAVVVLAVVDLAFSWRPNDGTLVPVHHEPLIYLFPLRVAAYFMAAIVVLTLYRRPGVAAAACWAPLVLAYALDMGSYRASMWVTVPRSESAIPARAFAPDPLAYRPVRASVDVGDPSLAWKRILLAGRVTSLGAAYGGSGVYALTYTFIGLDPCYPKVQGHLWQRGIAEALAARGAELPQKPPADFLPAGDNGFRAALGCGSSKIKLVDDYVVAESAERALALLKASADPSRVPVLETAAETSRPAGGAAGRAEVARFSANRVELDVVNDREVPAWLYYADGFHSDWRARLDGVEIPVVRANAGFKAVRVPPGRHQLAFIFGEGLRQIASGLLAAAGAMACLSGLVAAAILLAQRGVAVK